MPGPVVEPAATAAFAGGRGNEQQRVAAARGERTQGQDVPGFTTKWSDEHGRPYWTSDKTGQATWIEPVADARAEPNPSVDFYREIDSPVC